MQEIVKKIKKLRESLENLEEEVSNTNNSTMVSDLTVRELKEIIREVVSEEVAKNNFFPTIPPIWRESDKTRLDQVWCNDKGDIYG